MSRIYSMIAEALAIANDDTHGYSQLRRWGPDYDCSSLVLHCASVAGYDIKEGSGYTGNMKALLEAAGFVSYKTRPFPPLSAGDILLNEANHVALYIGDGQLVEATSSETGGIDGCSGDQTGGEISVNPLYSYPWDYVLRPPADSVDGTVSTWSYHGGDNQLFSVEVADGGFMIVCRADGRALDVRGGDVSAEPIAWPAHGGDNQAFGLQAAAPVAVGGSGRFVPCGRTISPIISDGLVLDVRGAAIGDGSRLCWWPANGAPNQLWAFILRETSKGTSYFSVHPTHDLARCLDFWQ